MENNDYLEIIEHYESCLEQYGDSYLGVDWNNEKDVIIRYHSMLDIIIDKNSGNIDVLDFGCGLSHMYDFIKSKTNMSIIYTGLDLSKKFIDLSKKIFPENNYFCVDILKNPEDVSSYDYIIMNGVFTQKRDLSFEEMFDYLKKMLKVVFEKTKIGIAFNVMSNEVDWKKEENFHLPFDLLADFLVREISRKFLFKHDYGMYEYTTYIYK